MTERTKIGFQILKAAALLGIFGDLLLRATPWGVNVLLFNVLFIAGLIMLLKRHAPAQLTPTALVLMGAQLFFAAAFVWRTSLELRIADSLAILAILSLLMLPRLNVAARAGGLVHYAAGFIWASCQSIFAPFMLIFGDVEWSSAPKTGWRKHSVSVIRGIAIAVPLILIFGALFMSADAVYEGLVKRLFDIDIDIETFVTHAVLFTLFAWLSAGYFRGILIGAPFAVTSQVIPISVTAKTEDGSGSPMERVRAESGEYPVTLPDNASVVDHLNAPNEPVSAEAAADEEAAASEKANWAWPNFDNSAIPAAFTLGAVETGIVLGLMNLLFLSFVIVQIPYLFGGMEMVQNTPDFKLSIYARRGFGELVAVSALVLPVLLGSHWLIRQKDRLAGVLFKSLASVQLILLFVIMASAVQRLVLLTGNLGYGMTNLRLYPLIFMLWLAIVFVWFSATVLRGARQYFAWGALWTAFIVLGATHFLDPDAFIVKTNIALMQQGREFDASFNSSLSDDALPYLYEALPQFNEEDQRVIAVRLARRYCRITEDSDWRSFNFAGSRASSILSASGPFAAEIDCEFLKNNWWRMRKVPPQGTVEPVSQPAEPLTVDGETNGRS